jgi:polysaccharide biosynthesis/export protein
MRNHQCQRCFIVTIACAVVLVCGVISTTGCSTGERPTLAPPPLLVSSSSPQATVNRALTELAQQSRSVAADYQIGAQDTLQITLFNIPTSEAGVTPRTTDVLVSQNGSISLPLLGDIRVNGLTPTAVEQELRQRYAKYLHEPEVGVMVKEYRSQRVSVIGAVNHPGVLPLTGPKTLIDILALAGGVSEKASGQVHLSRQGPRGQEGYLIDLLALTENAAAHNLFVQAEDIINVPKAGQFFVYGAINKPGSYPLDRPYRLTQALAIAGGTDDTLAKLSDVTIIRSHTTKEREALVVNMKDVLSAAMTDPVLEPDDVIVIPVSTPKLVVKRILDTVAMGLSVPIF